MKIGDEVYIHGYIDEIRTDTVIIKNDGGYFGTVESEVVLNQPEPCEDAVSRRRLLNDLKELIAAWKKYPFMAEQIKGVETAIGYVETIPSVKPDSKETNSTHKELDTISKQRAIDAINNAFDRETLLTGFVRSIAVRAIKDMPSAQLEQKWIPCSDCERKCNKWENSKT